MNQKGFANIVLIVLVVVLVGVVGYLTLSKKFTSPTPTPEQTNQNTTTPPPASNNQATSWQTYRSTKFGIELKYLADIFVVQGDDQYSKTLDLMDKRYAGKNVDFATVPNHFSADLAKDNSVDSLIEGERVFFSSPKSQVTILRTEEIKIDGVRAVKVTTGDKNTKIEKGFFIVAQLPRLVTIPFPPSVTVQPGEPNSHTYNLVSFSGKAETAGVIDKIVESIKFLK
ncbi:MAG: hypothetical protein NUV53_04420 [Patescibacteria group bacterium]|nr:hypothetical protein [Patescibacteria group bacterium]